MVNDYDEQFPPLHGSKNNKSGKGSRPSMVDCDLSTPNKSSQSQNWTSGKDALSLQRNLGRKNRGQGPWRKVLPFDINAPVDKSFQFVEKEANGPGFKHRGNGSRRSITGLNSTNPSTPSQLSQTQKWAIRKDGSSLKRNHRYPGCKNRDQSPKRRPDLPFDICSSVSKRNDRCIRDQFIEDKANGDETGQTVEVSNKHRVLRPGMVLLKHYLTHDVQVKQ